MTTKESQSIERLCNIVGELRKENEAFKESLEKRIEKAEKQVAAKYDPVNLEIEVCRSVKESVADSIKSVLGSYNSPLNKLVELVIYENKDGLLDIIRSAFLSSLADADLKREIFEGLKHKIARSFLNMQKSIADVAFNDLKNDAVFLAKAQVAISEIVEEQLKKS